MIEADVVIVGGGPAGCSCALGLRQRGLSVAVVSSPGKIKTPTETAAPQLAQLLALLGSTNALLACEPCYGISSSWGRSTHSMASSIFHPLGHAWFVHRQEFDAELQNNARSAGVKWVDALAENLVYDDSHSILSTSDEIIRARWFVIATGVSNVVGHFTGEDRTTCDSLLALWATLDIKLETKLLLSEPSEQGWWYACPDQRSRAMVCLVTDTEAVRIGRLVEPGKWIQELSSTKLFGQLKIKEEIGNIQAATIGFSYLNRRHGKQWIAIGDAAVKLDPLGSCGTMTALDSGRRAAIAIEARLHGNPNGIGAYEKWSQNLANVFNRQRNAQYALEQSKHGNGFWTRRIVPNV